MSEEQSLQEQQDALRDKFLLKSIENSVAQSRTQLDGLRPYFEKRQWASLPKKLYYLNGMFSRIDITLRDISAALSGEVANNESS